MQVANRHTHTHTPHDVYIGRGSPFGNKYSHLPSSFPGVVQVATREEAIALYRSYTERRLVEGDEALDNAFRALRDESVLVCSCYPKACHGNVIMAIWERWYK